MLPEQKNKTKTFWGAEWVINKTTVNDTYKRSKKQSISSKKEFFKNDSDESTADLKRRKCGVMWKIFI
jgi:hypothetical protein